ncbi:unnamed protein product, partial [Cylicostephanus goldi]
MVCYKISFCIRWDGPWLMRMTDYFSLDVADFEWYSIMDRLKKALGKRVLCDPAGILRDQEGKYIPDRFNRALQQERNGRRSPERRARPKEPPQWRLKEDDADATRTLFVGNMPSDIREYEIRK